MPWFPDFASAVELARRQTRAAGLADPVGEYFAALNKGDTHALETVWPGDVVIYGPYFCAECRECGCKASRNRHQRERSSGRGLQARGGRDTGR